MIEVVADGEEEGEKDEIFEHQSEVGEGDGDGGSGDRGEDGKEDVEKKKPKAEKPGENISVVESTEQKAKKELIANMWLAAVQGAPNTPAAGREGSPTRIRKAGKITPDKSKAKKNKK